MAKDIPTGAGKQDTGNDNQPTSNGGSGSPRIQGNWSVKKNGKMTPVNRKSINPS